MFAMANNGPEVLRMFWYWAWFRIRKASSRYFTGPLGPESEGAPHLRVYTCLCTFLVGSLLALSAAGQSAVPAGQSEARVTSPGAQGQDTRSTPPGQQPATTPPGPRRAVPSHRQNGHRPLCPAARRLSEAAGGDEHLLSDRCPTDTDGRRVNVHLPKHEHRARPVVEPGKRRHSRNSSESDDGQIHCLIELERRVLFQPLQLAERFVNLC